MQGALDRHRILFLAGALLCAEGLLVLAGWVLGNPLLVRIVPDSPAMSINTALMFVLSGVALLAAWRGRRRLVLALAAILALLPASILWQHLAGVDLGIDLASVHARLGDGHGKPGRTAPNACLSFLCAAVVLALPMRPPVPMGRQVLSVVLSALVLVIGVAGLLGYLMRLDAMYPLALYNKMAAITAFGMAVLGAGLWQLHPRRARAAGDGVRGEAQRITLVAVALLSVLALATGLASFAALRSMYERGAAEHHRQMAAAAATAVGAALERELSLVHSLSSRPRVQEALARVARQPQSDEARAALAHALHPFAEAGMQARVELGPDWHSLAGSDRPQPQEGWLDIGGDTGARPALGLRNNLTLRTHTLADGHPDLRLVTERPLADLEAALRALHATTDSTDALLCVRDGSDAVCFPSRFYPAGLRTPVRAPPGTPVLPVGLALQGQAGSTEVRDPRGVGVLAGYAPVPGQPLAVVVKTDTRELYLPLRERLHVLLAVVLALVGAGTLLLRRRVQPLIGRIVSERQRIKAILDQSNDGFVACDAQARITDWNLAAQQLFGLNAQSALGRTLPDLLAPPEERARLEGELARFLDGGSASTPNRRCELQLLRADGQRIPVEVSIARFRTEGTVGASLFLRDLTAHHLAAAQAHKQQAALEQARLALGQAQKLDAVGKLTGGVAHDFNNVLQVIKGSLELLAEENRNRYRVIRRIDTAMGAVERGAKLATQLLAFARRQPLQPKPTDLGRIVRTMGDMLQRALGDGVRIETVEGAGLWMTSVDPHQLEQVVLNLAINARDAMQGRGQLTIEVANAMLDEDYVRTEPGLAAGQYVMLAMSDSGSGMTAEVRDKAFEPFFSTKPEGQGTGLGLSMTYGFVKQSGGHIRIYSEPGEGTTIRLYLPRCHEAEQIELATAMAPASGGHETILVVEDDAAVQRTVCDMLGSLGYQVLRAADADTALALLEQGAQVDLLFTDVVMPGQVRSPDLARRARHLLPQLRILFTSGYTHNAIIHGGRLDPGVHLLSKPYGREQLARKLRDLLDRPDSGVPGARATTESAVSAALEVAAGLTGVPADATAAQAPLAALAQAPSFRPPIPAQAPAATPTPLQRPPQVEAAAPADMLPKADELTQSHVTSDSGVALPPPLSPASVRSAEGGQTASPAPDGAASGTVPAPHRREPAGQHHPIQKMDAYRALRIAFVEDNDDFRMMGTELLGYLGHEAVPFPDAEQALVQLRGERFDVLLTDLSLPGMSGLELAEQIGPEQPGLRIIVASGYGGAVLSRSQLAVEVLPKPFTLMQLRERFGQAPAGSAAGT